MDKIMATPPLKCFHFAVTFACYYTYLLNFFVCLHLLSEHLLQ